MPVQEPVLTIEESESAPSDLWQKVFSDKWIVQQMLLDGADFGHWCRRKRLWATCLHRVMVLSMYASLDNVIPLFYRMCAMHAWVVFDWGDADEGVQEQLEREVGSPK
eukprot:4022051-Karenia_brevis.AAC.1